MVSSSRHAPAAPSVESLPFASGPMSQRRHHAQIGAVMPRRAQALRSGRPRACAAREVGFGVDVEQPPRGPGPYPRALRAFAALAPILMPILMPILGLLVAS